MFFKSREPDISTALDASTPPKTESRGITPYLDLRDRLSQVWINKWTVLLFLVLVRTLLAVSSLRYGIADAKREALSACTSVEHVGSALASMPHYLSQGVNELTASGLDHAVNGLMEMLYLSVTSTEELIVFVINLLTSTYVCLITLAVSSSLHAALQVIEDTTSFLNKTIGAIGTDIHHSINDFENDLNKFVGLLNDVPKLFGSTSSIPTLNINSSLDALDHLQLPAGLDQGLDKLNASIPTFAQVNNFTNNAIRLPFEELKKLMNASAGNYTLNRSLFSVPAREQLSFCSSNPHLNSFFDKMLEIALVAQKVAIAVLLILATLACLPMAFRETRRWRMMKQRSHLITRSGRDPVDVVYIASRPYTSSAGLNMARRFGSTRRQSLVRWAVAYATTVPALLVLSLGVAGLFACLCQFVIVKVVEREVPALAHEVGQFADQVVYALNNASEKWANDTNGVILNVANKINHDMLGWVNISTTAINSTLNVFSDEMTGALGTAFNGTILAEPILGVFNCLIGLKIIGIEKGLTWVSDHAHVNFPLLPPDTFSVGAAASIANDSSTSSFLANPAQNATDDITRAVDELGNRVSKGIRQEAIIAGSLVGLYVLVVLIGIGRACVLALKHDEGNGDLDPSNDSPMPLVPVRPSDQKTARTLIFPRSTSASPQKDDSPRRLPPYTFSLDPFVDPPAGDVNGGDRYQGMLYTLQPRRFPAHGLQPAANKAMPAIRPLNSPVLGHGVSVGYAGARDIAKGEANTRISSYGDLGVLNSGDGRGTTF